MSLASFTSPTAMKKTKTRRYHHRHHSRQSRDTASDNIRNISSTNHGLRARQACERCRMKKAKCNGEFPCSRCINSDHLCTVAAHKKPHYKEYLPAGYVEALEQSQLTLVRTIHRLYFMVRHSEPWSREEPSINVNGDPVVHDISKALGCIAPDRHSYLPVEGSPPEDEPGMEILARRLHEQQHRLCGAEVKSSYPNSTTESKSDPPDASDIAGLFEPSDNHVQTSPPKDIPDSRHIGSCINANASYSLQAQPTPFPGIMFSNCTMSPKRLAMLDAGEIRDLSNAIMFADWSGGHS